MQTFIWTCLKFKFENFEELWGLTEIMITFLKNVAANVIVFFI